MKQRKIKKQYSWIVYPHLDKYKVKKFKRKSDAIKYLYSMDLDALNSIVRREIDGINFFCTSYELYVWFNMYEYFVKKQPLKLELRKGRFFRWEKKDKINKSTLQYFLKSNQIINLMLHISNEYSEDREPTDSNLKNLIKLFKFRFGKLPDDCLGYGESINKLEDCGWSYWSDRCGFERASTIIKCIKNDRPHLLNI